VPVAVLERYEASAANTSDGFAARGAPLGEEFAEALGTVRLLVARGEALPGQRSVAVGAGEALAVPRLVLVCHTSAGDDLIALDAASGELLFVASGAVDLLLARNEALGADGGLAHAASEARLVPLSRLVLHLLGSSFEDLATAVATRGELLVVAVAAEDLVQLGTELLVDQRDATLVAQETRLVPVLVLVRQILGVDADDLAALLAAVGEHALVAFDAVRVFIPEHVALPSQALVALPAAEVTAVPVLVHRLGVLAALLMVVQRQVVLLILLILHL